MNLLLGFDVGSSSIKATLLDADTGEVVASATSPEKELEISAERPGWAEQHPQMWWDHVKNAIEKMTTAAQFTSTDVKAIGISYQMHGLVVVDKHQEALRPSILWCDSRAVSVGEKAAREIGEEKCLERLLNLPGNFTATRLKWLKDNEPDIYAKVDKVMLPGDYIAMRMTGEIKTTFSGLSEMILWDFQEDRAADFMLEHFGFAPDLVPETTPTFSFQGELTTGAAEELGLQSGIPVSYRAGDQPNNALSLNVLNPGEIAVTAGTSGVVYGVINAPHYDSKSRVNVFVHVNHEPEAPHYGVLLCVSGTGILNSWLKRTMASQGDNSLSYDEMNELASTVAPGADGLFILPYGNGAERTLENRNIGSSIHGLNFNTHTEAHVFRAAQEGIVFALTYGLRIMRDMGIRLATVKAGYANMFLSPLFREVFASLTGATIELYDTDGSQGAARGAGIGAGIYGSYEEAFVGLKPLTTTVPNERLSPIYEDLFAGWEKVLTHELEREGY